MKQFGVLSDGKVVHEYVITNTNGMELHAINYGGIINKLFVPDVNHNMVNVVLGHHSLEKYIVDTLFIGAVIGPYANRISNAQFSLNNQIYELEKNHGSHHLHSGSFGFYKSYWDIQPIASPLGEALLLSLSRKDGENGYPGNVCVKVQYTLTDDNEVIVDYYAETDASTPINLTQHSYFNLSGSVGGNIKNHVLSSPAPYFLPIRADGVPTGKIVSVSQEKMDLRLPREIDEILADISRQKKLAQGLDHCYVLKKTESSEMCDAAHVYSPESGISLRVQTTQPALQCYTGNFLEGDFCQYQAMCLETQGYTNAVNEPFFPFEFTRPGIPYTEQTRFMFSAI
ncbi:MAG: aldose epimerase family protein [Bacteroidales bacterium]